MPKTRTHRLVIVFGAALCWLGFGCRYLMGITDRSESDTIFGADGSTDGFVDPVEAGPVSESVCRGFGCIPKSCATAAAIRDGGVDGGDGGDAGAPEGAGYDCGPNNDTFCCDTILIDAGPFAVNNGDAGPSTIHPYFLDRYEVTVGRMKEFIKAKGGTRENPPKSGDGAHPDIAFSDWQPQRWNDQLSKTAVDFSQALGECAQSYGTYSQGDRLPISCVTWFEAFAFCIWDGGRLPTEAEWSLAASGAEEQRVYPWSAPPSDEDAGPGNYCPNGEWVANQPHTLGPNFHCQDNPSVIRVGSSSPKGDGRFGHSEMGGNAIEWVFDWYTPNPPFPCSDPAKCAVAGQEQATQKVVRGGSWRFPAESMRNDVRFGYEPQYRYHQIGFRCARDL